MPKSHTEKLATKRAWRAKNAGRVKAYREAFKDKNPGYFRDYMRSYRKKLKARRDAQDTATGGTKATD